MNKRMKKISYIGLLLVSLFTSSCSDNLKELNKGEEALALTASATSVLSATNATDDGVSFAWTTGTNSGTDAAIKYTLEIAKSGTSFASPYTVDLGQGVYSLTYSEKQLNTILLDSLSGTPGTSMDLEARITAKVSNDNVQPQTATAKFSVTPYEKTNVAPYNMIYFVGSFTDWNFVAMNADPTNSFIFRYGAVLNWNNGGDFKFGTTNGSWDNMYHPTEASAPYSWTGVEQSTSGDNKWSLDQSECGKAYKMYLDITPGKESFHMSVFTPYTGMYMVGDATPSGWDLSNAMTMTATDAYTFTWTGILNTGAMKFSCDKQSDWNGAWFMPGEADEILASGTEIITFVDKSQSGNSDIDRKWKVTKAGSYIITLNQLTEKLTVVMN